MTVVGFFEAALAFPTALFTFLLVVAAGYWLLVLLSVADVDPFDAADVDGGAVPLLAGLGLGGVPATVVLTVLIALAWFLSLAGTALVDGPLRVAVLPAALGGAWLGTRTMAVPIRRLLPDRPPPSRLDFVGRLCVVRTGEVGPDFGQAEVAAADGSTAIIQVRLAGVAPSGAGWTALIYDYDPERETFRITPVEPAL